MLATSALSADALTEEEQRQIVIRYMQATGQQPLGASLSEIEEAAVPEKCGTPAILEYQRNRDRLDRRVISALGAEDATRPITQEEYGLEGGHVLLHYDLTGTNVVYQATVDSDNDGVPNYVEQLAEAAEYCYDFLVDTLGFDPPLSDAGCVDGGDGRVDVYLQALPYGYYGLTYNQSECYQPSEQHEAAWVVIDHDFQHLPEYQGRALDAAKVTLAHELFHAVHFAIDATESVAWFEMSAVWEEEQAYDDINDYYLYDYVFFNHPRLGLADSTTIGHMYQAAVFPIYLTEKYGRDIVKAIWYKAGDLGEGSDFLEAIDWAVDSAASSPANAEYRCTCYEADGVTCADSVMVEHDLASALSEFAVWNFFTGSRRELAPPGVGYSEGENYSRIPFDSMDVRLDYPFRVTLAYNEHKPQANGAAYIRLDNLSGIRDYDNELTFYMAPNRDPDIRWGVAGIFQRRDDPDQHEVVTDVVDLWETWVCTETTGDVCTDSTLYYIKYADDILGDWVCTDGEFGNDELCNSTCNDSSSIIDIDDYSSITLILTPSAPSVGPFDFGEFISFGYVSADSSEVDSSLMNLPAAVLLPYPNPAVLSEMADENITFRFRLPTDETTYPIYDEFKLVIELFTVAGEKVRTIVEDRVSQDIYGPNPGGVFEAEWDLKNGAGNDVASGVYLALAKLYAGTDTGDPLAEDQVKVALIR